MPEWSVQRRVPRYPIKLPILYKRKGPAPARAGVGWTRDLSEGGACLELAEGLEPSSSLQLFLRTDQGGLELDAEVRWAAGPAPGGGVLHGVAFTEIAPDQRQLLRDLILSKGQVRQAGVRLPAEVPVTCQPKGQAGPPLQGRTGDLSRAGLLLRLPQVLPPDTVMVVSLPTSRGPVAAEGVIVWVEPPEAQTPGKLIRHGVRFTDIGWASELALGLLLAEVPDEMARQQKRRPHGR